MHMNSVIFQQVSSKEIALPPPATTSYIFQTRIEPISTVPLVNLSNPPPMASRTPSIVLPDLSKPPPTYLLPMSRPVISAAQPTYHPQSTFQTATTSTATTTSPFKQRADLTTPPPLDSEAVIYDEQECVTPPHVKTPPHADTPPRSDPNLTLPPGAFDFKKFESSKQPELNQEAIEAFSAFNPILEVDL